MKEYFERLKANLIFNLRTLLLFETVYRLVTVFLALPFFIFLANLVLRTSGAAHVAADNFAKVFLNPVTLIFAAGLLFVMAFFAMAEISAMTFIFDRSEEKKKTNFLQTAFFAVKDAARVFSVKNWLIIVLTLFMLPMLSVGTGITFIGIVRLPDLWMDFAVTHPWLMVLIVLGFLLMIFFVIRWIFCFSFFTLEKNNFRPSRGLSRELLKGYKPHGILTLLAAEGVLIVSHAIMLFLGFILISSVRAAIGSGNVSMFLIFAILIVILCAAMIFVSVLPVPLCFSLVTTLFYFVKDKKGEETIHLDVPEYKPREGRKGFDWKIPAIAALIAVIIAAVYMNGLSAEQRSAKAEDNTLCIAHRGASEKYPENTMAAFLGAKDLGADVVELDVRESKDGELFILHDKNLKRVTGMNADIRALTAKEIRELDAGSSFNSVYAGTRIPYFSEVLEWASRKNMFLSVEIKPAGDGDNDITKKTLDMIDEYGMKERCIVASMDYMILSEIKRIDPEYRTVYISSIAFGDLAELADADDFSIEQRFVSTWLVGPVQQNGGRVFSWTVNDAVQAENAVLDGADGLITDDVTGIESHLHGIENGSVFTFSGCGWFSDFVSRLAG